MATNLYDKFVSSEENEACDCSRPATGSRIVLRRNWSGRWEFDATNRLGSVGIASKCTVKTSTHIAKRSDPQR